MCLRETDSFYSVYVLCAVFGIFSIFDNTLCKHRIRGWRAAILLAAAMLLSAAVLLANYELVQNAQHERLLSLALFFSGTITAGNILLCLFSRVPLRSCSMDCIKRREHPLRVFFAVFSLIVLIDLLYLFLVRYPGTLSPDSIWQMEQVMTGNYSNHHPFWNTIVIKFWIDLGMLLFQDINAAVALYSVALIMFVAGRFSYAATVLYLGGIRKRWILLAVLAYAFLPYHVAYSITMWKDVVFGGAALLFVAAAFAVLKGLGKRPVLHMLLLAFGAAGLGLWRSNGWLALLGTVAIFGIFLWKGHKKLILLLSVIVVGTWIMKGPMLDRMGVAQPDLIEALSIPEQQIARVILEGHPLTAEQEAQLSEIIDLGTVPTTYARHISDPIKAALRAKNPAYLEAHKWDYLKLWIELGLEYPKDYVFAWIDQTRGYWNGGYAYWIYIRSIHKNELGIVQTPFSPKAAEIAQTMLDTFYESTWTEPLRSIGLHVWIIAALFLVNLIHKRDEALLAIPILLIVATLMIATPVFSEFRYAYSVFTVLPFYLAITAESVPTKEREV